MKKYVFTDVTVYMRAENGAYVNLTDYEIAMTDNERVTVNSNAKYVIMACSYLRNLNKGIKPRFCEITFEELLNLAGIKDKLFVTRFNLYSGDVLEEILALFCAKKILDYNYGKIVVDDDNTCIFSRQGYACDGTRKKVRKVICTKRTIEREVK